MIHPSTIRQSTNLIIQLHMLLENYGIENLSQDEITFLQLHFLEKLDIMQIAQLTGKKQSLIQEISQKFSV